MFDNFTIDDDHRAAGAALGAEVSFYLGLCHDVVTFQIFADAVVKGLGAVNQAAGAKADADLHLLVLGLIKDKRISFHTATAAITGMEQFMGLMLIAEIFAVKLIYIRILLGRAEQLLLAVFIQTGSTFSLDPVIDIAGRLAAAVDAAAAAGHNFDQIKMLFAVLDHFQHFAGAGQAAYGCQARFR